MAITTTCPSCGVSRRLRDKAAGKKVRCPKCGERFVVPKPGVIGRQLWWWSGAVVGVLTVGLIVMSLLRGQPSRDLALDKPVGQQDPKPESDQRSIPVPVSPPKESKKHMPDEENRTSGPSSIASSGDESTQQISGRDAELQAAASKGRSFLASRFDPAMNLLPNSRNGSVYHLYHDNYLAANVLETSHPDIADRIRTAIQSYGVTKSGKIEIVFGGAERPLPFRHPELVEVRRVGDKIVKTEILTKKPFQDWKEYADLLFLAATALADTNAPTAKLHFDRAMAMWDGNGFKDRVANVTNKYAVYKLALATIAANQLKTRPATMDAVVECLLSWQSADGGWTGEYTVDRKPFGAESVETTSLAVLAVNKWLSAPMPADLAHHKDSTKATTDTANVPGDDSRTKPSVATGSPGKASPEMPQSAQELIEAALKKAQSGEVDQAVEDLTAAIQLDSDSPEAYRNRGTLYNEVGKHQLAMSDLDKAIKLRPDSSAAYRQRAVAHAGLKHHDAALADYTEAIRLAPENPAGYFGRSALFASLGDKSKARRDIVFGLECELDSLASGSGISTESTPHEVLLSAAAVLARMIDQRWQSDQQLLHPHDRLWSNLIRNRLPVQSMERHVVAVKDLPSGNPGLTTPMESQMLHKHIDSLKRHGTSGDGPLWDHLLKSVAIWESAQADAMSLHEITVEVLQRDEPEAEPDEVQRAKTLQRSLNKSDREMAALFRKMERLLPFEPERAVADSGLRAEKAAGGQPDRTFVTSTAIERRLRDIAIQQEMADERRGWLVVQMLRLREHLRQLRLVTETSPESSISLFEDELLRLGREFGVTVKETENFHAEAADLKKRLAEVRHDQQLADAREREQQAKEAEQQKQRRQIGWALADWVWNELATKYDFEHEDTVATPIRGAYFVNPRAGNAYSSDGQTVRVQGFSGRGAGIDDRFTYRLQYRNGLGQLIQKNGYVEVAYDGSGNAYLIGVTVPFLRNPLNGCLAATRDSIDDASPGRAFGTGKHFRRFGR